MSRQPPRHPPELVLVGGGHAHAIVLRELALRPLPEARITLVAAAIHTPYSGMLPGMIAGHYSFDATHIDLQPLSRAAGVRLIRDTVTGISPDERLLTFAERPPLPYDVLSLDVGSTPSMDSVPGAREHALPVKPIARFLPRWDELHQRVLSSKEPVHLATVGAGAGGVELTLSVHHRLTAALATGGRPAQSLSCHIFFGSDEILPTHPPRVRRLLTKVLRRRGITLHPSTRIASVEAHFLVAADGQRHRADEVLWVTQAGAAPWLAASGLATDPAGFVAVDACLRSVSHPEVFAAGDVAAVLPHPREKAGVFAVRQGPPLTENLRRMVAGASPEPFKPQRRFLTIVSTGDRFAVASRGSWTLKGRLMWRWKDLIDRRFMALFSQLPQPAGSDSPRLPLVEELSPSGARGDSMFAPTIAPPVVDAPADDDAVNEAELSPATRTLPRAAFRLRPPIDDPWTFGRIAATHALGTLLARGGRPQSVQLAASLPGSPSSANDLTLRQIVAGAKAVLDEHGTALSTGDPLYGDELSLTLAIEGAPDDGQAEHGSAPGLGDLLLLTQPLGTGLILEAAFSGQAKGRWVLGALAAMERSLASAVAVAAQHGASARTMVDQRGLGGSLVELLDGTGLGAQIVVQHVPLLDGAQHLSRGTPPAARSEQNRRAFGAEVQPDPTASDTVLARGEVLFDPQLSGGLLLAVPQERADDCLARLHEQGHSEAAIIGAVMPRQANAPMVTLSKH